MKNTTKVSQSDGILLVFENESLLKEYEKKLLELQIHMYKKIRETSGIWATNQDKFVNSIDQFNNFDSHYMENLSSISGNLNT